MLREIMRVYEEGLSSQDIRDIILNYSRTEVGLRARQGPVGFMVRDQGQVDQYAGRARHILTIDGFSLTMANAAAIVAGWINISPKEIRTLVLAGKTIDPEVHGGARLAKLSQEVPTGLYFCDAAGNASMPVAYLISSQTVFNPAESTGLESPDIESFNLSALAMGL